MRGRSHGICGLTYDIDMASLPLTRCTGPHLHLHRQGPCLPVRCVDGSTRSLVPGQAVHALANEADGTQGKLCSVDPDLYGVNVIADVPPPRVNPSLALRIHLRIHASRPLPVHTDPFSSRLRRIIHVPPRRGPRSAAYYGDPFSVISRLRRFWPAVMLGDVMVKINSNHRASHGGPGGPRRRLHLAIRNMASTL